MVAALDAGGERLRGCDREAKLELVAVRPADELEAGVGEDAERLRVVGQNVRDELRDSGLARSAASCSSSRVPMPRRCSPSATANATSAAAGSRRRM